MKPVRMRYVAPLSILLLAGGAHAQDSEVQYGANPDLPEPQRGLLPNMGVPEQAPWDDELPTVPDGYSISAIATDLQIPRQTLVLPNGDILVAEGSGGHAPKTKPKDFVAGVIKAKGKTSVKGGNRLTLLRDADGDGTYEEQTVFADNLDAPYGLALIDNDLYVANQGSLVRFDYQEGQTEANGEPELITELPSRINHHWTKAMTASADGDYLYVGIGSNSNITERGMEAEVDRAEIWEIDPDTGAHRAYATGVRNPTALAIQPDSDELWAVANERDELGPHLVPDYLTSIQDGGFYGWPYSYWGQHVDPRVKPENPELVESAISPDYSLGSHRAPLGIAFSNDAVGGDFSDGVFVGEHGSWNRADPVGYKVVFVPFENGEPAGDPVDFATGFLTSDDTTRGRPVGVTVAPDGSVIIADDLTNAIWRVTRDGASSEPMANADASNDAEMSNDTDSMASGTDNAAGSDQMANDTTSNDADMTDSESASGDDEASMSNDDEASMSDDAADTTDDATTSN